MTMEKERTTHEHPAAGYDGEASGNGARSKWQVAQALLEGRDLAMRN